MFNAPKTATGFTLPTATSSATGGFSFGASGDAKAKPAPLLGATPASSAPSLSFGLGASSASSSTQFNFGSTIASSAPATSTTATSSLSFSLPGTTSTPSLFSLSTPSTTSAAATTSASGFSLTNTTSSQKLPISSTTSTTSATPSLGSLATGTTSAISLTTTTSVTSSATTLPTGTTGTLTFAQLEDSINKWTVDLEEQGKHFSNQAKQINAWDRLLISNGEKILSLSSGIDRVKQLQQQLDQELDFVLAQQKELEDLVVPLEKQLQEIPVTDMDRNHTFQMAETLDTQLKQMSEDLKEIIEHLNESNKSQESSNPIAQIGRILNAHMNSLQWIDRNTTKITNHLDQIAKMHDMNKRNHEMNLQRTYD